MDINKPITRAEAILSGEDLEPMSRMEYFLKKAANGGGGGGGTDSSLPPYASEDIGKVLTVSTEDPVATETVIIPEQTVTITEGVADLSDVIEYAGEEAPVLGGDYAGWIYRSELLDVHPGFYIYSDPVLGDSKAIILAIGERPGIRIGSIENNSFQFDASISDVSATISATAAIPVIPTVSSVIVPTQNVTFENGFSLTPLSNVAISPEDVKPGTLVTATIIENGTTHVFTLNAADDEPRYVVDSPAGGCVFAFNQDANAWAMGFGLEGGLFSGEATVSIEGQKPKPKVKWESKVGSGGALYLTNTVGTLNVSYDGIMDAIDNGRSVYLKREIAPDKTIYLPLYSTSTEDNIYGATFSFDPISGTGITIEATAESPDEPLRTAGGPT